MPNTWIIFPTSIFPWLILPYIVLFLLRKKDQLLSSLPLKKLLLAILLCQIILYFMVGILFFILAKGGSPTAVEFFVLPFVVFILVILGLAGTFFHDFLALVRDNIDGLLRTGFAALVFLSLFVFLASWIVKYLLKLSLKQALKRILYFSAISFSWFLLMSFLFNTTLTVILKGLR